MLQKSLLNHINHLLTCQLNIIAGFGWYCFEQCLNIMIYIKTCLKIICFSPCTLDFACACWRKDEGRNQWERLVTSVLISLSQVDNTYWNKSDVVQNNYRIMLEQPNCASLQNSSTGQLPYTGKSRDRKKKASILDLNSAFTVSQDSSHQKSTTEPSNPCLQKTLRNLMMAQPSCCVALQPHNPSTRAIPLPQFPTHPSTFPKEIKPQIDPSPQLNRARRFICGTPDLTV